MMESLILERLAATKSSRFSLKPDLMLTSLSWILLNLPLISSLKVVSATFVLVCFLSLNKGTFQTRKNVFHFTSKALLVLKKIKF